MNDSGKTSILLYICNKNTVSKSCAVQETRRESITNFFLEIIKKILVVKIKSLVITILLLMLKKKCLAMKNAYMNLFL